MIVDDRDFLRKARRLTKWNLVIAECKHRALHDVIGLLYDEADLAFARTKRDTILKEIEEYDAQYYPDRKGPWMMCQSGYRFWPYDPRPEDINLGDIAHALGMLCRYCGHVRKHYSVGQHSVLVSRVVHPQAALAGLLHDAAEAYLGDIISPVKRQLAEFKAIEDRVMDAVCERFSLNPSNKALWTEVKRGDNMLLATEFRDVARQGVKVEDFAEPAMRDTIKSFWSPERAKALFLQRYEELVYGIGA